MEDIHFKDRRMARTICSCLVVAALCGGCSEPPSRKETSKVFGQLMIDGKPADSVAVYCHDVNGIDKVDPTVSACFTGPDGKFEISTYEKGDGVPAGEYALTFLWGQFNMNMQYGGPDKLHDRYTDPAKSLVKFKIESGDDETDLGQIELTTK